MGGFAWKSLLDVGWHGFPESSAVKRRRAPPPPVPPSPGASARRTAGGVGGGSDPRFLDAGAPPGRGRWCARMVTPSPLPCGGRSLHSDPCGKASEPMRKPRRRIDHRRCAMRTRLRLRQQQPERGAGRNRRRHAALHRRRSIAGRTPNVEHAHDRVFPRSGVDGKETALIATQSSYRLVSDREVRQWQASRSAIWMTK